MMRSAAALPFRDRLRELKRATHLLAAIDPPDDVGTLDALIDGLSAVARMREFPQEARCLRTVLRGHRAALRGESPAVVARTTGTVEAEGAMVAIFDRNVERTLSLHEWEAAQRGGHALFAALGADGPVAVDVRILACAPLGLARDELGALRDSTDDVVITAPSGQLRVSGLCGDGLDLPVEVGNVIAAIHVVDATLVVLVAPTELPVGDDGTSFELEVP